VNEGKPAARWLFFVMDIRQLERWRAPIYQIAPAPRVRTMADAARFIDRVGLCWLFAPAKHSLELPSLFEAVKGKRGSAIYDWDADAEKIWVWKSDLPAARRAYYGKALTGKPCFVSKKMLPSVLAALGADNFEQLYARGGISYEAKKIYRALEQFGPQPTMTLRRNAGLDGTDGNARYHRGLDELQRRLLVMPIGATNEVGNWPSQIFELVARWFPKQCAQSRALDLYAARRALISRYLKTVVAAPVVSIARLFAIPRDEIDALLDELRAHKLARREGDWMMRPTLPPLAKGRRRKGYGCPS
jgi:hypothetical protein